MYHASYRKVNRIKTDIFLNEKRFRIKKNCKNDYMNKISLLIFTLTITSLRTKK